MKSVTLVIVAMLLSSVVFADVYALIHAHTTFSDGRLSPAQAVRQARAFGADVVILTDHAEGVGDRVEEWKSAIRDSGSGFGMEVGLGPAGYNNLGEQSHLLYIGGGEGFYNEVVRIAVELGQSDPDQAILELRDLADRSGAALIAAHPVSKSYPFQEKWLKYVDAVEMYDNGPGTSANQVLFMVGKYAVLGDRVLSITGGSDFDGGPATFTTAVTGNLTSFAPDLLRFTTAETDSTDPDETVRCIKEGRCGACFAKVPPALMTSDVKIALGAINKAIAAGKLTFDNLKDVAERIGDVLQPDKKVDEPARAARDVGADDEGNRTNPFPSLIGIQGNTGPAGLNFRFLNKGTSDVAVEFKPGQILRPVKPGETACFVVVKATRAVIPPSKSYTWVVVNVWPLDQSIPNPGVYTHLEYAGFSAELAEVVESATSDAAANGWDASKKSPLDQSAEVYQAVNKYVQSHPHSWDG